MVNLDFLDYSTSSSRDEQMARFIRSMKNRFPLEQNNENKLHHPNIYTNSAIKDTKVYMQFVDLLVDKLGVDYSKITPQASFTNDLGCDSLDAIEILMEVELLFMIKIPDEELAGVSTVEDAVNMIQSYLKMYGEQ